LDRTEVEDNLLELKVKIWSQKSNNREEWASILKQAMVLGGPHIQKISELEIFFCM
jgi:hypothetical protein